MSLLLRRHMQKSKPRQSDINYEELKVDELKQLAKDKNVENYTEMKKTELIEALKG